MNTYKFTPEQEAWLKALESGEYKQGTGSLSRNGQLCCLGVACEVINKLHPGTLPVEKTISGEIVYTSYDGRTGWLSEKAVNIMKLRGQNGRSEIPVANTRMKALSSANDFGATFADIAAFIRANPTAVFTE